MSAQYNCSRCEKDARVALEFQNHYGETIVKPLCDKHLVDVIRSDHTMGIFYKSDEPSMLVPLKV